MKKLVKSKSRMFSFINKTCNPLGGECKTVGVCNQYCWAKRLIKKYNLKKYSGEHKIWKNQLNKILEFSKHDFVFMCDMLDLFEPTVPTSMIQRILNQVSKSPARFLLLTKHPKRYFDFKIPDNCVCGCTIESDLLIDSFERVMAMKDLKHEKMISVEPIIRFSPSFPYHLVAIKPKFVVVGYDNYKNYLDEPSLFQTQYLIKVLKSHGFSVYEKTIRERLEKKH